MENQRSILASAIAVACAVAVCTPAPALAAARAMRGPGHQPATAEIPQSVGQRSYAPCASPKVTNDRVFEVRDVMVSLPNNVRNVTFTGCVAWNPPVPGTPARTDISVSYAMVTRSGTAIGYAMGQPVPDGACPPDAPVGTPCLARPAAAIPLGTVPLDEVRPEVMVSVMWIEAKPGGQVRRQEVSWVPFTFLPAP